MARMAWVPKLGERVRCIPGAVGSPILPSTNPPRTMTGGELGVVVHVNAELGVANVRLDGESADDTMRFAFIASQQVPKHIEPE